MADKIPTLDCAPLTSKDPIAYEICRSLAEAPETIEPVVCNTDYSKPGAPAVCRAPSEQDYSAAIYQSVLRTPDPYSLPRGVVALFEKKFGSDMPWLLDASHIAEGKRIVSKAIEDADAIKTDGKDSQTFLRAQALLSLILAPRSRGGLDILFVEHDMEEGDINQAMDRGTVRCSEFQKVFYGLGRLMGLDVYPLEIYQYDENGAEILHGAILINDPSTGSQYIADAAFDKILRKSPYQEYYIGTAADLFAIHAYNSSLIRVPGEDRRIMTTDDAPIVEAESVAPGNALILYGLAVYHRAREEDSLSMSYLQNVLKAKPDHVMALRDICFATWDTAVCDLFKLTLDKKRNTPEQNPSQEP